MRKRRERQLPPDVGLLLACLIARQIKVAASTSGQCHLAVAGRARIACVIGAAHIQLSPVEIALLVGQLEQSCRQVDNLNLIVAKLAQEDLLDFLVAPIAQVDSVPFDDLVAWCTRTIMLELSQAC